MRVNIVEEVERHVRLQKAGRSYKGLSPFATEKTPSFYVNPDKGAYYCFSTTKGGDVIRFVQEVEHLPFGEAIEVLAQRHNITLEYESGSGPNREERSRRAALIEIHEQARAYYHQSLMANDPLAEKVREYWTDKRGFSLEVAADFSIGFDPPASDALLRRLLKDGFAPDLLIESGLFVGPEDRPDPARMKSRFRGRLMIPIREPSQGQVVAFTARELFCTPGADQYKLAKYVNSPGTPLFHKSRILFNLERAQKPVRSDEGGFLIVEGQLDAIRCFTNGFTTAIAPQGTSITDDQLHILKRYSDKVRVVLDGDAAGQRAALRVLPMCFAAGLEPTFVVLPAGQDPDSMLSSQGADSLKNAIDAALSPMQFMASALLADPEYAGPRGLAEAMKKSNEILASVDSEVARQEYLKQLCERMRVDYQAARADLARHILRGSSAQTQVTQAQAEEKEKPVQRLTTLETDLWYLILQEEALASGLLSVMEDKWIDTTLMEGRLLGRYLWELKEGLVESIEAFASRAEDEQERNCLYEMQVTSANRCSEDPIRDAEKIIQSMFVRHRKSRIAYIDAKMASGELAQEQLQQLLQERVSLTGAKKQLPSLRIQG